VARGRPKTDEALTETAMIKTALSETALSENGERRNCFPVRVACGRTSTSTSTRISTSLGLENRRT
jgi:hypothetical protein